MIWLQMSSVIDFSVRPAWQAVLAKKRKRIKNRDRPHPLPLLNLNVIMFINNLVAMSSCVCPPCASFYLIFIGCALTELS